MLPAPLQGWFTANRVAAITTWLVGLAAFITGIVGTLPLGWQNTALAIVGLLKMLVTALHFMSGSQKWDALTFHRDAGQADAASSEDTSLDTDPSDEEEFSSTPFDLAPPPPSGDMPRSTPIPTDLRPASPPAETAPLAETPTEPTPTPSETPPAAPEAAPTPPPEPQAIRPTAGPQKPGGMS